MELKGQISSPILSVSFLALELSFWLFSTVASPMGDVSARQSIFKGISDPGTIGVSKAILIEVSAHDAWNLPVVQQPAENTNYVSNNNGEVTQFASANQYGNIGLLAHNYLSGKSFSEIRMGQEIHLVYSDGRVEDFIVTEILRYKALDPKSPYSSFQNLSDGNEILTVGQMFDRAYQGGRHVTFQTCIAAEGNSSWGRLFVIASPKLNTPGLGSVSLSDVINR